MIKFTHSYPERGEVMNLNSMQVLNSGNKATVALKDADTGSINLFDSAAGIVYTLPKATADVVGACFDFVVTTTVTSNAHKIITNNAAEFLIGSLTNIDTDSSNAVAAWTADGSTIRSISMNGTTTGGLKGTVIRVRCVSTTLWVVEGTDQGNGVVATPFATS